MDDRILSPYVSPNSGASYLTKVSRYNAYVPDNLYLVVGDELLELRASQSVRCNESGSAGCMANRAHMD